MAYARPLMNEILRQQSEAEASVVTSTEPEPVVSLTINKYYSVGYKEDKLILSIISEANNKHEVTSIELDGKAADKLVTLIKAVFESNVPF